MGGRAREAGRGGGEQGEEQEEQGSSRRSSRRTSKGRRRKIPKLPKLRIRQPSIYYSSKIL